MNPARRCFYANQTTATAAEIRAACTKEHAAENAPPPANAEAAAAFHAAKAITAIHAANRHAAKAEQFS